MTLDLTQSEMKLLATSVDHQLTALYRELVHTDARFMQAALRNDIDELERLRGRLSEREPASRASAPS
jgi:hypothetical protein